MRVSPATCLIFLAACGSTLQVGHVRPGYVVAVRERDGELLSRACYDGAIDEMYGFRAAPKRTLYVASYRNGAIYQYRKGKLVGVVAEHLPGPTDVLVLPGGDLLVACSGSAQHLLDREFAGRGALLRVRANGAVETFVESEAIAVPTALVADADGVIYVGQRGSPAVLRLADGKPVEVHAETDLKEGPMHLALSPDGVLFAASPFDGRIVRVDSGTVVVDDEFLGRPGGLAFGEDGELLVTSYDRGEIRAYDPGTGEVLRIVAHGLPTPWAIRSR